MGQKERINAITKIYYSRPEVQNAIVNFSLNREVVPRYTEAFGKRPDTINYPADVMGLVNRGATSFHCSEELWQDPLEINSDMSIQELNKIRKSWDLLIDIDSPFLDYSKVAAQLIVKSLEKHGVFNYGIKFSGSKGFHIIVPAGAFPEFIEDKETKVNFPEWPRAIVGYLMDSIKKEYNAAIGKLDVKMEVLQKRMNKTEQELTEIICPECGAQSKKGFVTFYSCPECKTKVERKNAKSSKRNLKCIQDRCTGLLKENDKKTYYYCEKCKTSSLSNKYESEKKVTYTKEAINKSVSEDFAEEIAASKVAAPDMILVSSRHLFRMPYSLHEKTALASIVLTKDELETFSPKDANPYSVKIKEFYSKPEKNEAEQLLISALSWKRRFDEYEEEKGKKFESYKEMDYSKVKEDMFPKPIKKLLKGLSDGRKRGLFILLTFLKTLNFSPELIEKKVHEWNKNNDPPLKEGYVKSQVQWHLKQKRKILPPNYKNESYYKDLNLLDNYMPKSKNPVGEVIKLLNRLNK